MMRLLLIILFNLCVLSLYAKDTLIVRQDTFPSQIKADFIENGIQFKPIIRPLVPIPGGRQAYYTYLWDFGDGNFSTQESPIHQYTKPGEYDVSLFIVNNYDNGPRPKKPKTKVKVESMLASNTKTPNQFEKSFFKSNDIFQLFKNANAVPGEDMSLVVGVKPTATKGKIILLTNEKLINPSGFLVANQSQYNQEKITPILQKKDLESMWANVKRTTITQSGSPDYGIVEEHTFSGNESSKFFNSLMDEYTTVTAYDIEGAVGETQFSIINMDITPEMLADTNAIVTVTGIYLADNGDPTIHKLDIPIIKSHDPNKMSVRPALLDYRLQFKKKTMTYKVQFQNDGEGDAKVIRLEMHFPEQINTKTFKLLNLYPQCDTCKTDADLGCYTYQFVGDNQITFTFRGISLPGTASPILTDQDSTKGFIRFQLKTDKKLQNKSLPSFTDIFFDKNDPIRTNKSTVRFRPGLSPLVFLGLNSPARAADDEIGKLTKGLTVGVGIAPIAPYKKPYWQIELYASTFGTSHEAFYSNRRGEVQVLDLKGNLVPRGYLGMDSSFTKKYISLQIPVQIRYNISRYFSAGVGAMIKTNLNYVNDQKVVYHLMNANGMRDEMHTVDLNKTKEKHSPLLFSPLVDINVGRAYLGPALGVRYHYDKTFKNNINLYLMCRL